jgi:hypothetical protein
VWVAFWLVVVALFMLHGRKHPLATAGREVLWPLLSALVFLLVCDVLFSVLHFLIDPTSVSAFESWLLDVRDSLDNLDKSISPWLLIIPLSAVAVHFVPARGVIARYLSLKKMLATLGIFFLCVTSFTWLGGSCLPVVAEWEYSETVKWYEVALRKEHNAIGKRISLEQIQQITKLSNQGVKRAYARYFYALANAIPENKARFPRWPDPVWMAVSSEIGSQASKDVDALGLGRRDLFKPPQFIVENVQQPFDTARAALIRYAPKAAALFKDGGQVSASTRRDRINALHLQQERTAKTVSETSLFGQIVANAFSEWVGAYLYGGESLVKEYVEDVAEDLTERVYSKFTEAWSGGGDIHQGDQVVSAIMKTVPSNVSVRELQPVDAPVDKESVQRLSEAMNKRIVDEVKREVAEQQREAKERERIERERFERK